MIFGNFMWNKYIFYRPNVFNYIYLHQICKSISFWLKDKKFSQEKKYSFKIWALWNKVKENMKDNNEILLKIDEWDNKQNI